MKSPTGPGLSGDLATAEAIAQRVDLAEILRSERRPASPGLIRELPIAREIVRRVDLAEIARSEQDLTERNGAAHIETEVKASARDRLHPVVGLSWGQCERTVRGQDLAGLRRIEVVIDSEAMRRVRAIAENASAAVAGADQTGGLHSEVQRALAAGSRSLRTLEGSFDRMPGNAGTAMLEPRRGLDRVAGPHDLTADAEIRHPAPGAKAKVNALREEGQTESGGLEPIASATHRR